MEVVFLDIQDVLEIHAIVLARHGGLAGVRDLALLDSAVSKPSASFEGDYLHEDIFAMAAAYLFHIVRNHPFVDGNKRTALLAALTFLDINGLPLDKPNTRLEEATIDAVEGRADKLELAAVFRSLIEG